MKKFLVLFLTLIMLLGATATAVAESFDLSVFEGAENMEIYTDEIEDYSIITLESNKPCFFDPEYSEHYYCSFYPSILYHGEDNAALFSITCNFYGENWAFFDEIIVKVGTNRYSFTDVEAKREVDEETVDVREVLRIWIDSSSVAFMKDLEAHSTETIKVRLKGDNYDCDFTMSDTMIESILNMYDLFVQAGGTDPAFLSKGDGMTPMTVR